MQYPTKLSLILLLVFCSLTSFGQECNGSLGEAVINLDFDRGQPLFGPSIGNATTYEFVSAEPKDGEYTIAKNTIGMYPDNGWHQISNHTPNDPNGYMMIVNSSINPGIVFQKTLSPLCAGTTYVFEAWVVNLINYPGIRPNLNFQIETKTGQILKVYNSGEIPDSQVPEWLRFATTFTVGNETDLVLKIINLGVGGIGNDLAFDDISIRACGPIITQKIDSLEGLNEDLCEGESASYRLEASVSADFYANPRYQWQSNTGAGWNDIVGERSMVFTAVFNNAREGTYQYRLLTADESNINSPSCRVSSSVFTIRVNGEAIAENSGPVCVGGTIQLSARNAASYSWTGPNFSSQDQNPILLNASKDMSGDYILTVTTNGCTTSDTTTVSVLDQVKALTDITDATICEGDSLRLSASGGISYEWIPSDGLSNPKSPNPTASPKENTVYRVLVSNGACFDYADINIKVIKTPIVNAGIDIKILEGQSTRLNGKVTGDYERIYWTPTDHLDDPSSLNPTATPPTSIRYTLTAVPRLGCKIASDEVFIKVSPNIIIPNSFSPNGDGINDMWVVPDTYASSQSFIKIVNRNGQMVFQSNGSFKPWDGKFHGRDLPSAVYYYSVYLSDEFETFSGWINLIR